VRFCGLRLKMLAIAERMALGMSSFSGQVQQVVVASLGPKGEAAPLDGDVLQDALAGVPLSFDSAPLVSLNAVLAPISALAGPCRRQLNLLC
jgi:hypothetical protein